MGGIGCFLPVTGGSGWRLAVGNTSRQLCRDAVPTLPVTGGSGWRLAVGNTYPATCHPELPPATRDGIFLQSSIQPSTQSSIQSSHVASLVNGPTSVGSTFAPLHRP